MHTYISLLRGINVGGHKKVLMTDLKKLYEKLGFSQVQTYIQSGNVVFVAPSNAAAHYCQQIEQAIVEQYGFEVSVQVHEASHICAIVQQNPFLPQHSTELDKLLLVFFSQTPSPENLATIDPNTYLPDTFVAQGAAIYLYCPNGYGQSKLTNDFFERKLKLKATTRNQRTAATLCQLAQGAP
jgi:uncharacterized protein (DUF1697 family)